MADKTYTVTVATGPTYPSGSSGNVYYLDGTRPSDYNVAWPEGATLRFEQSDATNDNHPLIFSTNTSTSGMFSTGVTYYLDGISNSTNYTNTTTFNAATTRYVEVTPSSSSNFYWLCYVHGIGMGGTFSISAEGWSSATWGFQSWGVLGNASAPITGQPLSANLGSLDISGEINNGWGRAEWGTLGWGIAGTLETSGFSLPMTLASVAIDNQITVGWGRDAWGAENWGESTERAAVTGLSMTAAEGSAGLSFDGDSNVTPTGNSLTVNTGTLEAFASFTEQVTGFAMTAQVNFNPAFGIITGNIPMSISLGNASGEAVTIAEVSSTSASTWGQKSSWGFGAYGNAQIETLTMSMLENFSGVDPAPDAVVTGQAMAMALAVPGSNNFNIIGDGNIAPLSAMNWGDGTWGESTWGDGLYRPDTDDIFPLTLNLGSITVENITPVSITGFALTATLNSVSEVSGDGDVIPTGNLLTMGQGTGTNTLIWNGVDPGTAPIDPPGWKPVDTNAA